VAFQIVWAKVNLGPDRKLENRTADDNFGDDTPIIANRGATLPDAALDDDTRERLFVVGAIKPVDDICLPDNIEKGKTLSDVASAANDAAEDDVAAAEANLALAKERLGRARELQQEREDAEADAPETPAPAKAAPAKAAPAPVKSAPTVVKK